MLANVAVENAVDEKHDVTWHSRTAARGTAKIRERSGDVNVRETWPVGDSGQHPRVSKVATNIRSRNYSDLIRRIRSNRV